MSYLNSAPFTSSPTLPPSLDRPHEPQYSQFKKNLAEKRRAFKENAEIQGDLKHYLEGDNSHEYTALTGLIPKHLVGNVDVGGGTPFERSDTFLTDYRKHNPPEYILSSSEESFIIGNRASHDVRQYTAEWDPSGKDRTAAASMSYLHLLVIPQKRVYNTDSLEDTHVIKEMIDHFQRFWSSPNGLEKAIERIQLAVEERAQEVINGLEKDPSSADERKAAFEAVMRDVRKSTEQFASKLRNERLTVENKGIVFKFHQPPSIGHLHMHVLASPSEFRQYSTTAHDHKAMPAEAVVEVIDSERSLLARLRCTFRRVLHHKAH